MTHRYPMILHKPEVDWSNVLLTEQNVSAAKTVLGNEMTRKSPLGVICNEFWSAAKLLSCCVWLWPMMPWNTPVIGLYGSQRADARMQLEVFV